MNGNGYLIDNDVIFLPSEKTIKSIKSNKTQTLHAPAIRCLQLLIESKTTVPQASLYKAGWGQDALKKVSTATYYQCFVNLRKQLRKVDYYSELLITVPKEGMRINDAIKIIPFTPSPGKRDVTKTAQPAAVLKKLDIRRLVVPILVMAGVGSLVFIFFPGDRQENRVMLGNEEYQRYRELPECVYVHSESPTDVEVERTSQFIHAKNLSCKPSGRIFIYQGKISQTVFQCDQNMHCHSITHINKSS